MTTPPRIDIDPAAFATDPYPVLKRLRAEAPVAHVPQLDAILLTRRDDIFENEKKIDVFSSDQPGGMMTRLMGKNMMRKDGAAHQAERQAIFPTISPRTVRDVWARQYRAHTRAVLDGIAARGACDLVRDYAMPVAAHALRVMTGLINMTPNEMNRVSQGMIDGCANYAGDPAVEARCHDCTASIDRHIDASFAEGPDELSLLAVQRRAGLSDTQTRANIKLVISGGQNEPRDAIAGTAWALLTHPNQLALVRAGKATWLQAFQEYARWQSPIGMSPRRIAKEHRLHGIALAPERRAFLMFGSGNRDETAFARPDLFDITQDIAKALSFGAGPHFCAGAWAARTLIADIALPMLFDGLTNLRLAQGAQVPFTGWAFRGPLSVPVIWDA